MALSALGQFALPVSDADRSEGWYRDVLGLPPLFRFGDLVFFDCGGVRLMLEASAEPVQVVSGVCHYFRVGDIEAEVRDLSARGLTFEAPPHLIATMPDHELWMVFFRDPDGHMLAFMEERALPQAG